jgi:formylglycine-generating enzyme required for sulfatase activity
MSLRFAHLPAIAAVAFVLSAGTGFWLGHRAHASAGPYGACHRADKSEVRIPSGTFRMGAGADADDDITERAVTVPGFSIDRFAVTNAEFAAFVAATGYVTDAERTPDPADYPDIPAEKLSAGGAVFEHSDVSADSGDETRWWKFVAGADWRHPEGPGSGIKGKESYPVVQVSYDDALAYAHWRGRELPTEEQYEYAARGGLDGKTYAWGDELTPGGKHMANTWQGEFPSHDAGADGFAGLAPDGCFPPNGYGLYDMIGNAWEWTTTLSPQPAVSKQRALRVIKGGSYLCSANFCHRYRPAAHQVQESNFSSVHLGFRTVGRG